MSTITITINYADDPAFNQNVRDIVEKIFATCFDRLESDQVIIKWSKGLVDSPGRSLGLSEWDINLNNQLQWGGVAGQSAGYESNINVGQVQSDAGSVPGGQADVALANVIAHEIGVHVIADYDWTHPDANDVTDIGNESLTEELTKHPGYINSKVCAHMRIELAKLTWLS